MRAFEICLNGKRLCVAGFGEDGVLSAIASWVAGTRGTDCFLEVAGLLSASKEHLKWIHEQPLKPGDTIQITVTEASNADEPIAKSRDDREKDIEARKKYVRKLANDLGWEIQGS
jgi:hypothetical protein